MLLKLDYLCFSINDVDKVPQRYSVHEGDATMFIQGSDARTKKEKKACTLNCEKQEARKL